MKKLLLFISMMLMIPQFILCNTVVDKAYSFYEERNFTEGIRYFQKYTKSHPRNTEGQLALQIFCAYGMHASFDIETMRQCMLKLDSTSELANDFLIEYIEGCECIPREDIIRNDGPLLLQKYSLDEADKADLMGMIARAYEKNKEFKKAYRYYKLVFPYYLEKQKQLDSKPYTSPERGVKWSLARLKSMRDSINETSYNRDYQACVNQTKLIGHDDIIETYENSVSSRDYVMRHNDTISYYNLTPKQRLRRLLHREIILRENANKNQSSFSKEDHLEVIADIASFYASDGDYQKADSCLRLIDSLSGIYFPKVGDRLILLSWLYGAKDRLSILKGDNSEYTFQVDALLQNLCNINDRNIIPYVNDAKYTFSEYRQCFEGFVPHMYDHCMNRAWLYAIDNHKSEALRSIDIADSISSIYLNYNENQYLLDETRYGTNKYLIQAKVAQSSNDKGLLRNSCSQILTKLKQRYWEKFVCPHQVSPYTNFWGAEVYSEHDRQLFHDLVQEEKDAIFSYASQSGDSQLNKIAYDMALLQKSLLLRTQKLLFVDAQEKDPAYMRQLRKWKEEQLSVPFNYQYDSIQNLINQAEAVWVKQNFDRLGIKPSVFFADVTQIQHSLRENEVAIEFVNYREWDGVKHTTNRPYCALLLRQDSKLPELIPLFEESEIIPLINASNQKQINKMYGYKGNGMILAKKVWDKILPYIKQGETIYFSPSGFLQLVAIENLPYSENQTMANMHQMVRVSSTRELLNRKTNHRQTTATLYGDILYDVDKKTMSAQSNKYPRYVSLRSVEESSNRGKADPLPWTKKEIESINTILKESKIQVHQYTSAEANEESFKALSGKHRNVLHIATHGFFWSDSTAHTKDYFTRRALSIDRTIQPSIDPLIRCGLLFAGAQTAWSGHGADLPKGVQDGILTAKEISLLDLRDADLVVLSACETGKGEIYSDGVFGLQRAFKQAGAQTIIMSLWPVHDKVTQLLMTEFYKNWIERHQSRREAFLNAQTYVRTYRYKDNQPIYQNPYYWAGFIVVD